MKRRRFIQLAGVSTIAAATTSGGEDSQSRTAVRHFRWIQNTVTDWNLTSVHSIRSFLTRDGQPVMSFGVMGGDFQPQGHAQVVMNTLDFGMSPQQAGDQPRIAHSGSSSPWGAKSRDGGSLTLEHGIDRCRSTVQSQSLEPESDSHPELSTIGCGHADSPVRPQRLQESQFRPHAPSSIACLV